MQRLLNALGYLFFTYPVGVVLGVIVWYLRWRGFIRLVHPERFPRWQRGVILAANHLSMLEPLLLPGLFFRQYGLHPFLFSPWSAPDFKNFGKWYWFWMWPRAVFIPRGEGKAALRALLRLRRILQEGGIVILHPEGGRTSSGGNCVLTSPGGKRLRPFKPGFAFLAAPTEALVVPIWIEGTDVVLPNSTDRSVMYHRFPKFRGQTITIRIGEGIRFNRGDTKEKINRTVQAALLALADEDDSV